MLRKKQYIDILWGNTLVGISMSDHESSSAGLETYRLRGGTTLGLLSNTNSNLLKSSTSTSHFEYFELGTWCPWSSDHHLSPYLCNSNLKEDLSQTAVIDGTQRHLCRRQVDENLHHGQTLRFLPCAHGCNTSPSGHSRGVGHWPGPQISEFYLFFGGKILAGSELIIRDHWGIAMYSLIMMVPYLFMIQSQPVASYRTILVGLCWTVSRKIWCLFFGTNILDGGGNETAQAEPVYGNGKGIPLLTVLPIGWMTVQKTT